MSAQHRIETRQRVFLRGRIVFNNGAASMDCLVRDMSATGARVALSETSMLPSAFDLLIPQRSRTYRCNLAWRSEDGIGVTFVVDGTKPRPAGWVAEPAQADVPVSVLLDRIAELEAENNALRRLLASMAASGTAASAA